MQLISLKKISLFILTLAFLTSHSSCIVTHHKKDNGKQSGWFKSSEKPHHQRKANTKKEKGTVNLTVNKMEKVNKNKATLLSLT